MVGATAALSVRRVRLGGRLFNAASCALAGYAASAAYLAAGGHSPVPVPGALSSLTTSVADISVAPALW
jgi:hypothetical protein